MDAFKLLTRSTKLKARQSNGTEHHLPSEGPSARLHSTATASNEDATISPQPLSSRKRKRSTDNVERGESPAPNVAFFQNSQNGSKHAHAKATGKTLDLETKSEKSQVSVEHTTLPEDECRTILKSNKIKIVDLTQLHEIIAKDAKAQTKAKSKKKSADEQPIQPNRKYQKEACRLYPQPLTSFRQLRSTYGVGRSLAENVLNQGFTTPTEVQLASIPLLMNIPTATSTVDETRQTLPNLLTVAATGSGKTLAFLIPLINRLLHQHHTIDKTTEQRRVSALILAPTKELVGQIVNEGRKLTQRTGVSITAMRKGMTLSAGIDTPDSDDEFDREELYFSDGSDAHTVVKSDILVTTPLLLLNVTGKNPIVHHPPLNTITSLVLDEADVLLDTLFREQTLRVWNDCTNPSLHVSFWSATIGSNIESLVQSTMASRESSLHHATPSPPHLIRLVVGLKDSALPSITHRLIYAATESGKLLGLRQLLHPASTPASQKSTTTTAPPALRPPFLIFTQTIDRAIALHTELLYDIPSVAGGSSRIAVLHSSLSDTQRAAVMARFRLGEIWVLITTDLLSRGIDFRGINGVVNYDIPTSSAGYVHRVGRTGRAGREGGVAITFYTKEDIGYVKGVANVIAASEKAGKAGAEGGVKPWLLNALPEVSKKDRQRLKMRGVEVRRSVKEGEGGEEAKKKRKARISTMSGYERKLENNRLGAVAGSRRRMRTEQEDGDGGGRHEGGDEWGGLDD